METINLYNPHPNQQKIIDDTHRFKVVCCGRRFGKTTLAVNELLYFALNNPGGLFWYVSPTYRQSKTIAWRMLLEQYYLLPKGVRRAKNESELSLEFINGSRIELKGADNEDSLRGSGLDGLVVDEVASIKNWKVLWEEVLRPALTDRLGWAIFISTPKGFNHFYDIFIKEKDANDYKSFLFTSYDNPYLASDEIENAKRELNEDAFSQEYLAEFRKFTGLIYREFDRKIHVIESFEIPTIWQFYRMMDFGAVNPTVCLWFAVDSNDTIYVYDEYYNNGQTAKFHAGAILARTHPLHQIVATWGDPSAQQEMLDYAESGLFVSPAIKSFEGGQDWVKSGISRIRDFLKLNEVGKPRLFVFKNCEHLIKEFETYHWLEKRGSEILKDQPDKIDDHCMDALRYGIGSVFERHYSQYSTLEPLETNPFTGYSGNIV